MDELIQLRDKQSIVNVSNEITKDLDHFSIYELILQILTDYQPTQISPVLIETLIDRYIVSIDNSIEDLSILLSSIKQLNFPNSSYSNIYYDLLLFKISIINFRKCDFNSCISSLNKISDLKFKDAFKLNYLELNLVYSLCFKVLKDSTNFDKYILKSYKLLNSPEFTSNDNDNDNGEITDLDINRFKLIKFKIMCTYSDYLVTKNKLSESIETKFRLIQSYFSSSPNNLVHQRNEYTSYLIQLIKSFLLNLYLCEFNSSLLKNMMLFYKLYKSNSKLQNIISTKLDFKILLILKFIENKIIKLDEIEEIQKYFHDEYEYEHEPVHEHEHDHDNVTDGDSRDDQYEELIFNNLIKLDLILISKNFENIKFNQILNLINFENYSIIEELLIDLNNNKLIFCKIDHIHEIVYFDNGDKSDGNNNDWVTSILSNIDNLSNDI